MTTSQVFVSRTSDMARFPPGHSFVQAVLDAVTRAGLAPVDMDYFAARDGQPAGYCQQRVRDCEIYLAVIGLRYGSLVPGEDVSYTELEFLEATAVGRPRLVFLLDETAELPAELVDADRAAVDGFRQRVQNAGLICARFSSPDELKLLAYQALTELTRTGRRVVPRQLPPAVAHFAGRAHELATLTGLLRGRADTGATVVISAIGGTAGVGKTALAVTWAHRVADQYPDGQLYVDLRGFSPGQVVAPADAIRQFLDALEVPPERIPVDLDAQAALYRSQMAGRRMLVVLDNAGDSAQVRPLVPGVATCRVLVTSRKHLSGLVATAGAHLINLDVLSVAESQELLALRLGPRRVADEPDAVTEIITCCARLPLALALVAARAAARPRVPLSVLARELADARQRWEALTGDDPHTDVRAVFSWSYQTLTPATARLFRLLGLHPGPDIAAPAAASLAGLAPDALRPLLAELLQASVLTEPTPGRYTFHDLLRDYAIHLAYTTDTDQQRHAATGRILDHYLHTAQPADRLLNPARDPAPLASPPRTGVTPQQFGNHGQAWGWFTAEHQVLMAAVTHAAAIGFDTHTWQLAWTLWTFLYRRGHWHDWVTVGQAAVAGAQRLADPTTQARSHRYLANAYLRLGRLDDAHTQLRDALDLDTRNGDQTQQAHTHQNLAILWERRGQRAQALRHARQALHLYQATGHQAGQAGAFNLVGWYHSLLGDHQQALTYCQQALTLHQQLDNREGQAATWDSLGHAHHHGQHTKAVTCYQHALTLFRALSDRYGEADVLTRLGDTHHSAGNPQAARESWQRALTILDDLDHADAAQVRAKLASLEPPTRQAAP